MEEQKTDEVDWVTEPSKNNELFKGVLSVIFFDFLPEWDILWWWVVLRTMGCGNRSWMGSRACCSTICSLASATAEADLHGRNFVMSLLKDTTSFPYLRQTMRLDHVVFPQAKNGMHRLMKTGIGITRLCIRKINVVFKKTWWLAMIGDCFSRPTSVGLASDMNSVGAV